MIGQITPEHHAQILKLNAEFVHWLSPLEEDDLRRLLSRAVYSKQIDEAQAVLIGYPHDIDDPDHFNLRWLRPRFDNFFYIDRIIVERNAQGKSYGRRLYEDIETFARERGYSYLCCEVNTRPDNPRSHKFHLAQGFLACGEQDVPEKNKALRYYAKRL